MDELAKQYSSVADLLSAHRPANPVYCVFPDEYVRAARDFVADFPGRVLFAVKANNDPRALRPLIDGGVCHFDCASLPEIATVKALSDQATCYFMTPVRLRGAAKAAQSQFGVRHFLIDHLQGIDLLDREIDLSSSVVFVRMAVSHESAMVNLSKRFGAPPEDVPALLQSVYDSGAEPALAFNVGSSVTSPDAYRHSLVMAKQALESVPFRVRLLDIGGGFPKSYPGFEMPPLQAYFDVIRKDVRSLPLASEGEILVEPGRALAAPGMSAIVEIRLRKENRLYLNDGMYGIFWELRFKGHDRFPVRSWREGQPLEGRKEMFRLFGPTCDSMDELPGSVALPADIGPGDYLEFGNIGAYSLAGRTAFNGFHSEQVVTMAKGRPPQ